MNEHQVRLVHDEYTYDDGEPAGLWIELIVTNTVYVKWDQVKAIVRMLDELDRPSISNDTKALELVGLAVAAVEGDESFTDYDGWSVDLVDSFL